MSQVRTLASAIVGAVLLSCALPGCERRAPGPEECSRFAQAVAGTPRNSPWLTLEAEAAIEAETRQCLTVPYDYELLNCVLKTRQTRACLSGFRRRQGSPG